MLKVCLVLRARESISEVASYCVLYFPTLIKQKQHSSNAIDFAI